MASIARTAIGLVLALLAACGGGGGNTLPGPGGAITGTAATGRPVEGLVTAIGSKGVVSDQAGIGSDGRFRVEIDDEPPYLLMAQSATGNLTIFGIAFRAGHANITPYSDRVLRDLFAGSDLASVFNNWSQEHRVIDETRVRHGLASLVQATASVFQAAGVDPAGFDVLESDFAADHTGFDSVLDQIGGKLPEGRMTAEGLVYDPAGASGLVFIDPADPAPPPSDDADMGSLTPRVDTGDAAGGSGSTTGQPALGTPGGMIYVDPDDPTPIPDDADMGELQPLQPR